MSSATTEALALAAPENYVRVFADEGAPMAHRLGRARRGPAHWAGRVPRAGPAALPQPDRPVTNVMPRNT